MTRRTATIDELRALRERWRQHEEGRSAFANMLWQSYRVSSPVGRFSVSNSMIPLRLSDAFHDLGGSDGPRGWRRVCDGPATPVAVAMTGKVPSARYKVPIRPEVLDALIAYAEERIGLLDEAFEIVRPATAERHRWGRLRALLAAERDDARLIA